MATKLESKVVRESSVQANDREIIISLNEDQTVSLKLKGMKSGTVSISIKDLWNTLNGSGGIVSTFKVPTKQDNGDVLVSVRRLRTLNAVTHSDLSVTVKLEEILTDLLKGKEMKSSEGETKEEDEYVEPSFFDKVEEEKEDDDDVWSTKN
jgi:hypothetical protein